MELRNTKWNRGKVDGYNNISATPNRDYISGYQQGQAVRGLILEPALPAHTNDFDLSQGALS
jgi:hypothetical protein